MRHFINMCLGALVWVILAFPTLGMTADTAKAKLIEGVLFEDCAACHSSKAVLPPGHVSLTGDKEKNCFACHCKEKNGLRARIPLSHIHLANDMDCMDCHDQKPFAFVSTDRCRECHGDPEEISALTQSKVEFNPHESPHYGNDMDCDLCHHLHAKSENVCGDCHDLKKPTP